MNKNIRSCKQRIESWEKDLENGRIKPGRRAEVKHKIKMSRNWLSKSEEVKLSKRIGCWERDLMEGRVKNENIEKVEKSLKEAKEKIKEL